MKKEWFRRMNNYLGLTKLGIRQISIGMMLGGATAIVISLSGIPHQILIVGSIFVGVGLTMIAEGLGIKWHDYMDNKRNKYV